MLVHAHGNDLVIVYLIRHFTVVPTVDLDLPLKSHRSDPLARIRELLIAQRNADPLDAVARSRPAQQTTPAAANVQQPLARLEPQLAADMLELLLLRGIQILLAGFRNKRRNRPCCGPARAGKTRWKRHSDSALPPRHRPRYAGGDRPAGRGGGGAEIYRAARQARYQPAVHPAGGPGRRFRLRHRPGPTAQCRRSEGNGTDVASGARSRR